MTYKITNLSHEEVLAINVDPHALPWLTLLLATLLLLLLLTTTEHELEWVATASELEELLLATSSKELLLSKWILLNLPLNNRFLCPLLARLVVGLFLVLSIGFVVARVVLAALLVIGQDVVGQSHLLEESRLFLLLLCCCVLFYRIWV